MYAVMEITDKSVVAAVSSSIRLASPMIKSSPRCPTGVASAAIYYRTTHTITMMKIKGNSYVVVRSGSIPPTTVLQGIKELAEQMGGRCQILSGVEASAMGCIADKVN